MICAIVLAAGRSQRMGTQKLLLPWRGQTVISAIIEQLLRSKLDRIAVVTGPDNESIVHALQPFPVDLIVNPDPHAEMLTSVRCSLGALPEACAAVLLALGDQPRITAGLIDRLITAFQNSPKDILVPAYQGRRGHPLLFARRYFLEIQTRYDGVGLRGLLQAHPDDVQVYDLADDGVISDMDTPDDYRRELERYQKDD